MRSFWASRAIILWYYFVVCLFHCLPSTSGLALTVDAAINAPWKDRRPGIRRLMSSRLHHWKWKALKHPLKRIGKRMRMSVRLNMAENRHEAGNSGGPVVDPLTGRMRLGEWGQVRQVGGSHVHAFCRSHVHANDSWQILAENRNYTRRIATTCEVETSIFSGKIQWKQRLVVVFVMFVSRWKQAVSAPKIATTRSGSQLHAK